MTEMSEMTGRANALLRQMILSEFRDERRGLQSSPAVKHLVQCESTWPTDMEGEDSVYGCDTGCSFVRFAATMECQHGKTYTYRYGTFGDLEYLVDRMETQEAK